MAVPRPIDLQLQMEEYMKPKPPPGDSKGIQGGFMYRGTLFRPSSANISLQRCVAETAEHDKDKKTGLSGMNKEFLHEVQSKHAMLSLLQNRAQSAKGRLERVLSSSPKMCPPALKLSKKTKSKLNLSNLPSVIHLNEMTNISTPETVLLTHKKDKANIESLDKKKERASSAKYNVILPKSIETTNKNNMQPLVSGLNVNKRLLGEQPEMSKVWTNIKNEFPFKVCTENENFEKQMNKIKSNEKELPKTLEPLLQWSIENACVNVIGMDPGKCWVFLSQTYDKDDLPELPASQGSDENLAYTFTVVAPRKQVTKRYKHPCFEKEIPEIESEDKDKRDGKNPKLKKTFRNPPTLRGRDQIILEIEELENLMKGIGSINSTCSFVQFQDEIKRAQILANKLIKINYVHKEQVPIINDSFGLLKVYKEHEEIMKSLHARRNQCLEELNKMQEHLEPVIKAVRINTAYST